MRRIASVVGVAAVAAFLIPGVGHCPVLVVGGGLAEKCYQDAERGHAGLDTLDACNLAIDRELLTPKDRASTFVNRGVVKLLRRDYEAAVADFDQAISMGYALGEAYVNRGAARLGQRRYREALEDLDRGLSMGATEPAKAWYDKGMAHEGMGDVKSAYYDYRKASELRPDWQLPKDELKRFSVREE
jgi:tetratricopeptide (TPR) repeat protein